MKFLHLLTVALLLPFALTAQTLPDVTCASTDSLNGDVTISFIPNSSPCGGGFVNYEIFASTNQSGPYSSIGVITNPADTFFTHFGANGTILKWWYYVVVTYNCGGAQSFVSDTVADEVLSIPEIKVVTVTDTGVLVIWNPVPSSQVLGYNIYEYLGGNTGTILSMVNNRTYYLDAASNAGQRPIPYVVAARDQCDVSPFSLTPHTTIYLEFTSPSACEEHLSLDWTSYQGWPAGVEEYRVMASEDGSALSVINVVTDTSQTEYTVDLNTFTGNDICFVIKAIGNDTASLSNKVCFERSSINFVTYNYITNVTVENNTTITVEYIADTTADIQEFRMRRQPADGSIDTFQVIEEFENDTLSFPDTYLDEDADPNSLSYFYQLTAVDTCGNDVNSSIGRSIHLTGASVDEYVNELEWNPFELEHATVLRYKLYREVNNTFVPHQNFGPGAVDFRENVIDNQSTEGQFCYYIEADFRLDLPGFGLMEKTSRSNVVCVFQDIVPIMPNVFVPDGINNVLKPVIPFGQFGNYTFKIFNRWGEEIFSTQQPETGWNGRIGGTPAPLGGYAYIIQYEDEHGRTAQKTGVVVLLR